MNPEGSESVIVTPVTAEAEVFPTSMMYVAVPPAAAVGDVVRLLTRKPPAEVIALAVGMLHEAQAIDALLVSVPAAPGITLTCTVPPAPGSTFPRFHATTPALSVPPSDVATKIAPDGRVSVSVTPVAVAVPVFR